LEAGGEGASPVSFSGLGEGATEIVSFRRVSDTATGGKKEERDGRGVATVPVRVHNGGGTGSAP
jgi:hypothetical protein